MINGSTLPYNPIDRLPDLPIPDYPQVAAYADQDMKIHMDLATELRKVHKRQPINVS